MQEQQVRSMEIDKTLADLRAEVAALQSASVSSVETKNAGSDWPLPSPQDQQAPRHTGSRPIPSHPLSVRVRNTRPPFYLPSRRLRPGTSRMMNSKGVRSSSVSLVDRTRIPSGSFVTNPSQTPILPSISCSIKAGITHVSFSKPKLLVSSSSSRSLVWVAGILPTTRWQCDDLQTCLSATPELFDERQIGETVGPPSVVRPASSSLTTSSIRKGSKPHLSSTGRAPECVSFTNFAGSRCV